ncbi:MAG: twin-arginine translocase subunit TatC [Candidatus Zixiibacteriota bacterium]
MVKEIKDMGFLDHLEEFRSRIIKCLVSILIFSIVAYFFSDFVIDFLARPVTKVYFMSPTEAFAVRIKMSIILGIILSIPVIFYQFWQFVVPGLFESEVKAVVPAVLFSTLFFIMGGTFCFFLVMPMAIKFLMGFGTDKLEPMIRIGAYISFISYTTLAFGIVFELPVVAYFLGKLGIITDKTLRKGRRYAILGILILAATITPPDIFSQVMLAVPLYFLYEVSIVVLKMTQKRKEIPSQETV